MQQELDVLKQLQEYDLEIQQIQQRTTSLRAALGEITELHGALATQLDKQKRSLEDTRKLMRQKTGELEDNGIRYAESKEKLNKVANAREYNALENEMEALRKLRGQLEEELEQLKDAVADSQDDVEAKQEKTDNLAGEMEKQQAAIDKEQAAASKRATELENKRTKLKKKFADKKVMIRRYEFIRGRLNGQVIVPTNDKGVCTGCNMGLQPQLFNELMRGERMILCPTCQRILYYVKPEPTDSAD